MDDRFNPSLDSVAKEWDHYHLRVQVWIREDPHELVVAFGGTDFSNFRDWLANFRWFIPDRDDVYSEVSKRYALQFADAYKRAFPYEKPSIVATGHSLGGGLAQHFAYALPADEKLHRVSTVYAFDSSPVTGWSDIDEGQRDRNARDLTIQRL